MIEEIASAGRGNIMINDIKNSSNFVFSVPIISNYYSNKLPGSTEKISECEIVMKTVSLDLSEEKFVLI